MRLRREDEIRGADAAEHDIHYEGHTIPPSVMGVRDECMSPVSAIINAVAANEENIRRNSAAALENGSRNRLEVTHVKKIAWDEQVDLEKLAK